jgi:hypothetical protein
MAYPEVVEQRWGAVSSWHNSITVLSQMSLTPVIKLLPEGATMPHYLME